jgi:plasmid stabilization system protein ParE
MPRKSKKYRIRIQREAILEIDRIAGRIAEKSFRSAASFLKGLRMKISSLGNYPDRGARVRLLEDASGSPVIRWIEFKRHLVFYAVDGIKVIVLHVTAPGQDWLRLLA